MFSEENIERTKERLVEYVKDNAYSFGRKYDKVKGQYGGHWSFTTEELSAKPIEDAIEVLGSAAAVDIIAEILNEIYGVSGVAWYQVEVSEEPVGLSIAQLDSNGAFDKLLVGDTSKDFLVDDEDEDEDYYDDYDEDDYGYDDDYDGFYDEDEDDDEDDEYKVFISGNSPLSLYEQLTQVDIKSNDATEPVTEFENEDEREDVSDKEMVNHPPHYNQGKFETIDIIEDIVAGYDDPVEAYLVGTTLKYLARAPFKGAKKQDLEKADFYLKRAIDRQKQQ